MFLISFNLSNAPNIWNYCLWCQYGVAGAAIATAISFVAGGVMMFVRYYRNPTFNFKKTGFHFYPAEFKECLSIGIPVVLERSVICLGQVTFSSLIAKLGVVQFAAHTIAIQAEQAFYIPGYGFQSAASTLVGNAIGQKSEHRVKEVTYLICAMTVLLMIICGDYCLFCRKSNGHFYT
ncbi:MATE family efflux transporter [Coprobacillaceae bacterium CR2/5/TPMF4]|nr:MATE family efflux transporter [Coprobacillaceae bacterium CR2/5/TPMF4]